jgi:hypothetical protein
MPTSRKTQSSRRVLAGRRAKKVPSKKPKRSRTGRISAKVFEEKFTAIVTGYLSTLPLEEQDTVFVRPRTWRLFAAMTLLPQSNQLPELL